MKIRKEVLTAVLFVFFLFLIVNVKAPIFMGTCEGYVFYSNGTKVSGANVTVSVDGCTTPPENCIRSKLTDSGGYYVIANLNLEPYGNVSVAAQKGTFYGTSAGQADAYQAAYVNVTLCEAPSSPTLVPVPDSHYPNITFWFNWTSGSSPHSTFDQWNFDGAGWITASSPQSKTNLAFKNYTWSVRTCLSTLPSCCSPPSCDAFSVYNTPPCPPILTPQPDTNNNTVTLNWSSNTTAPCPDPDNDTTYYNFKIDGNLTTNATPPMIVSGLGYGTYTWQVQECDPWQCSAWVGDTFNIFNHPCPVPNLTDQPDTCVNQITLQWTSASVDSDGETCYDEFFFHNTTQSPASSPQTIILTDQALYTWRVRSCDPHGACSSWAEDTFIFCTCPPIIEEVEEGRRIVRGYRLPAGYELVFSLPKDIYPGEHFDINMNLKYFLFISNLTVETETPEGIEIETLNHGPVAANTEIRTKLKGKTSVYLKEGTYYLFVKGYDDEKLLFNKPLELRVVSPPITIVSLLRLPYFSCCLILIILIVLIIVAASIWVGKEIYKKLKEKTKGEVRILKKIKERV